MGGAMVWRLLGLWYVPYEDSFNTFHMHFGKQGRNLTLVSDMLQKYILINWKLNHLVIFNP